MQRKKASKGKSAGLSRLEKVVVPAQATANYRAPVTRRQGLRGTKVEVELATEVSKNDVPDGDFVPSQKELIDEPGDDEVNANDGVSGSICEDQEEEDNSSFVTATETKPRAAALSPMQDEEWEEVVRRAEEREEEELAEEEEKRQRRVKREEQALLKNEKEEEKARQQLANKEENDRAKQEKKEETRLKKVKTLKKRQQEEEARKEAELAAQEAARHQECMEQKRREGIHAALVKSHEKIAEEMAEKAEANKKRKEQIAADMAIDLRRRLDLARGLAGSSSR